MPEPPVRDAPVILFLCTGNSARSILAEAALNAAAGGRARALSAGSHPQGIVHPRALALLRAKGMTTDGLRSKSWGEFAAGTPIDLVITVCDAAAGETCPAFGGRAVRAHWGIPDPAAATEAGQPAAFEAAWHTLAARIDALLELPFASLDDAALHDALRQIAVNIPYRH